MGGSEPASGFKSILRAYDAGRRPAIVAGVDSGLPHSKSNDERCRSKEPWSRRRRAATFESQSAAGSVSGTAGAGPSRRELCSD